MEAVGTSSVSSFWSCIVHCWHPHTEIRIALARVCVEVVHMRSKPEEFTHLVPFEQWAIWELEQVTLREKRDGACPHLCIWGFMASRGLWWSCEESISVTGWESAYIERCLSIEILTSRCCQASNLLLTKAIKAVKSSSMASVFSHNLWNSQGPCSDCVSSVVSDDEAQLAKRALIWNVLMQYSSV